MFTELELAVNQPYGEKHRDTIKLKRAVGRSIRNVDSATLTAFYSNVNCPYELEEKAFYIACLLCEQGGNGSTELPAAWASYAKKKSLPHAKFTRLIDTPWSDTVAYSLVRIIRRLTREGYSINLEKLMYDVVHWNSESVKQQWARKISEVKEQ